MNNQATLEKMKELRLGGMMRAFRNVLDNPVGEELNPEELAAHLVDAEWDERKNRKYSRLIKNARFRYKAAFEEIDHHLDRNLKKQDMLKLSDCQWIRQHKNIIITGPTGCGKSFIASALGHRACLFEFKAAYYNCLKLNSMLKESLADRTYEKEIKKIAKSDLLILDDFGLNPLDDRSRLNFLEILEDRHGLKSTIIVSQLPVNNWHHVIGDRTVADAICDRMIHTAVRIELKGESVRKIKKKVD
ncbi:MAG: IS21-like element helper ATPase IstB [Candidatus Auribacterota bacterium]|nr:IS21-like element helper ATPase IstB [Candidatus Auribacterota bacterium]